MEREQHSPPAAATRTQLSTAELVKQNEEMAATIEYLKHEIVRHEQAKYSLNKEQLILRTLIDSLPDGIYAKDAEGRKTMSNPSDVRNIGCKCEADVLGKTDYDLFPRELAEHYVADDQAVLKKGVPVLWREEYVPRENGEKRWIITTKLPMRAADGSIIGLVGIGRDITPMKEAERKLDSIHKDLVRASRVAGMAEVATSVLHNVGNVLNSVNVAATVILDRLNKFKINRLSEIAKLMQDRKNDLPNFLTTDPRGMQIADFLTLLAKNLEEERTALRSEVDQLGLKIDHIKQIVAMQQNYAKVAGLVEKTPMVDIIEDAINIHSGAYVRHEIKIVRQFEVSPIVFVDRHKVLQILGNLLSNAKYACDGSPKKEKLVTIHVQELPEKFVRLTIADNGMGISKENLDRIFGQGFTTRKEGHGFGLHSCAITAKEIGGTLTVHSDGLDQGAVFTLEIPLSQPEETGSKP